MDANIQACHPRFDEVHYYMTEKDCAEVGYGVWREAEDIKMYKCVYLGRGTGKVMPETPPDRDFRPAGAEHEQEQTNRNAS